MLYSIEFELRLSKEILTSLCIGVLVIKMNKKAQIKTPLGDMSPIQVVIAIIVLLVILWAVIYFFV